MKKSFCLILVCLWTATLVKGQTVYVSKNAEASFFSETPLENIAAVSKSLSSVLNIAKNEIMFLVPLRSFKFDRAMMEEHFNEKYVESDKFPQAIYKGKINEIIVWANDTVCKITSTGTLNIHGVEKQRTDTATLTIKQGQISIQGSFDVHPADHNIDIPTLVVENIAEQINVKFKADYMPYKKEEKSDNKKKEDKK